MASGEHKLLNSKYFPENLTEKPKDHIFISYSQYALYKKCPLAWKLCYLDKIKDRKETIDTLFGSVLHTIIQEWLEILYVGKVKDFEAYDYTTKLKTLLKDGYKEALEKANGVHFSTKEQLIEFYVDGIEILSYIKRKRKLLFDRKHMELVGIELPLYHEINGVYLVAYMDLLFYDKFKNKYYIVDLKKSRYGWRDYDKKNDVKTSQLVLYKIYLAKNLGIDPKEIEIDYYIMKQKVPTDTEYPIPRISKFSPANGSVTMNKVVNSFESFIVETFVDGKYNTDREYLPNPGKDGWNCKYCEYADKEELCPKSKRKC